MAFKYELAKEEFTLASDKLKNAQGPFKSAKDALTGAISDYTRWMFEGGGSKPATSNGSPQKKTSLQASDTATKNKAYWESMYKAHKKSETTSPDAGASKEQVASIWKTQQGQEERGRDAKESDSRGRGGDQEAAEKAMLAEKSTEKAKDAEKHKEAAEKARLAEKAKEKINDAEEHKKLVEEALKSIAEKQVEREHMKKAQAEARKAAQQRYENEQKEDEERRAKVAKKIQEEDAARNKLQKAKLANQFLQKAQAQAKERATKELQDALFKQGHGRSSEPLFKRVSVKSHCGGINGDGSLQEECDEEPTGDQPRKADPSNELPWASHLQSKPNSL